MDCQNLVKSYIEWLKQKISVENINGICEITTPFLDRHNDNVQIYIKRRDTGYILTDDGYTITDLELSGFDFKSEKRKYILQTLLNGFGVKKEGGELVAEARPENFPQKKHNLIQAILSINDLFVLASPTVASLFKEDVERYLRTHEIRFTPSVNFTGRSGFVHYFDFVIPASTTKPERILKAINHPAKQNITSLIFSWTDTRDTRSRDSKAFGVLNDTDLPVNSELVSALRQYDIEAMPWSEREGYVDELAA